MVGSKDSPSNGRMCICSQSKDYSEPYLSNRRELMKQSLYPALETRVDREFGCLDGRTHNFAPRIFRAPELKIGVGKEIFTSSMGGAVQPTRKMV